MENPEIGTEEDRQNIAPTIQSAKRIVVKIGTSSLVKKDNSFDLDFIKKLAFDVEVLHSSGKEVLIVSSGAVNAGREAMKLTERPRDVVIQQVLAAIGNPILLEVYSRFFTECCVAQILLTQRDLSDRQSFNHFREALEKMLEMGTVPIINENDVVSIDELTRPEGWEFNFSDNDVLSALVTGSIKADLLVILSDTEGLYSKNPNSPDAEFIPYVKKITPEIWRMAQGGGKLGRGGMTSKLLAAEIATTAGATVVIAHAKKASLKDIIEAGNIGTAFPAQEELPDKKVWMLYATIVSGKITVDGGARDAVQSGGASLLFAGIRDITGHFHKGDIVEMVDEESQTRFARGIVNYSSDELDRVLKMPPKIRREYLHMNKFKDIVSRYKMVVIPD